MLELPIRLPAPSPFELWLLPLAGEVAAEDAAMLDAAERARAARFVFERDRRRYILAHAGLRRLLGHRVGLAPAAVRIETGQFGKPRMRGDPRCAFSLSHSGDRALIAMAAEGRIGVDLERAGTLRDVDDLANGCLCGQEILDFDATPEAGRELAFLGAWTRKEACLKAIGIGLNVEPSAFSTGLDAAERRVRIPMPAGECELVVRSLVLDPGWVAALANVVDRADNSGK